MKAATGFWFPICRLIKIRKVKECVGNASEQVAAALNSFYTQRELFAYFWSHAGLRVLVRVFTQEMC